MKLNWRKTTVGVLAASLTFSTAAFAAQGNGNGKGNNHAQDTTVEASVSAEATVTVTETSTSEDTTTSDKNLAEQFNKKLEQIQAKYEIFNEQDVPAQAVEGKNGSIQNRVDALKAKLEELAPLQEELKNLEGAEADAAVDSLTQVYVELGKFEEALKVQKEYVKTLTDESDAKLIAEYKEIGKLLKKMGKLGVKALVNGEAPDMDVEPIVENGRTLVPFRALAESLGAEVTFDATTKTVTVTNEEAKVVLTINSMIATVDGKEYKLDVPAKIVKGRTVIPLRFLSEGLKAKVLWDQETQVAAVISVSNSSETTANITEETNSTTTTQTKTTTTTSTTK